VVGGSTDRGSRWWWVWYGGGFVVGGVGGVVAEGSAGAGVGGFHGIVDGLVHPTSQSNRPSKVPVVVGGGGGGIRAPLLHRAWLSYHEGRLDGTSLVVRG